MDIPGLYRWVSVLGTEYGVDPLIFAVIYVGAIPFFSISLAWLLKNLKQKKPVALPMFFTGFFFVSAYLYLIVAGKNVPLWVYGFIAVMVVSGVVSTVRKIRMEISRNGEKP